MKFSVCNQVDNVLIVGEICKGWISHVKALTPFSYLPSKFP